VCVQSSLENLLQSLSYRFRAFRRNRRTVQLSNHSTHTHTSTQCTDCLIWCPEVYQQKKVWYNVDSTLKRCKRLKCDVCKRPHAPLGCQRLGCDEVMKARERKRKKLEEEKKKKLEAKKKKKKIMCKKRRQKKQKSKIKSSKKRKALALRPHNTPDDEEEEEEEEEEESAEEEIVKTITSPPQKINPLLLRLRPVVSDLFKRLRKDDLPVQKIHDTLTEFDVAMGRPKTSRADLDEALKELEEENRVMYREYDGVWTVFLI